MEYSIHNQRTGSNVEYALEDQQEQLYMFGDDKYFSKMDPANQMLLKDGDLFMDDGEAYQAIKLEDFENTAYSQQHHQQHGVHPIHPKHPHLQPHQYHHHHQLQHQDGNSRPSISILQTSSPIVQAGASTGGGAGGGHPPPLPPYHSFIKTSSPNMFKSSINSYLTPYGSSASDSSSKPLTLTGRSTDDSNSRTSSQEIEDIPSSSHIALSSTLVPGQQQQQQNDLSLAFHNSANLQSTQNAQQQQQQSQESVSSLGTSSSSSPTTGTGSNDTIELPEDVAIRRAEQNRAAQRAFRQRKQKYIKWLESKAEELDEVYRIMALVRAENQQLCNVVMELDEKLNSSGSGATTTSTNISNNTSYSGTALQSSESAMPLSGSKSLDLSHGNNGRLHGKHIHGIDESLGREISMRLMNLATFPGLGSNGDRDAAMMGKIKYQPRNHAHSKASSAKGKMAFKMSQQSKQQGALLQAALQPGQLLQQQQQQQASVTDLGSQEHALQPQNDMAWMTCSPASSVTSSAAFYSSSPSHSNTLSPHVNTNVPMLISTQPNSAYFSPPQLGAGAADLSSQQQQQQGHTNAAKGFSGMPSQDLNSSSSGNSANDTSSPNGIPPLDASLIPQLPCPKHIQRHGSDTQFHSNISISTIDRGGAGSIGGAAHQQQRHLGSPSSSSVSSPVQIAAHLHAHAHNNPLQHQLHHSYANIHQQQQQHLQHQQPQQYDQQQHQQQTGSISFYNQVSQTPFSMANHLQQQAGQLYWLDDDASGTGRGRRSSMPTLHFSVPLERA